MARDRKAEAARRNERARAAGYDSYGQMYRAGKQGYGKGEGSQFRAAKLAAAAQRGGVQRIATGAGVVLSADTSSGTDRLLRAIGRETGAVIVPSGTRGDGETGTAIVTATVGKNGNVSLVIERDNGNVVHVGGKGGISADKLADYFDEYGDAWADYLAEMIEAVSYGG